MATDMIVTIGFDTCKYRVVWPDFFLQAKLTTAKQLLQWLCRYSWQNEESYRLVDEQMPELVKLSHGVMDKALKENKAKEDMDKSRRYKYEEQQEVAKYYAKKARWIRKFPETAAKLEEYWKELTS